MQRSSAAAAGETLVCCLGTDCAGEAQAPCPAVATGHVAVGAVDPTDVGVAHLDVAVAVSAD